MTELNTKLYGSIFFWLLIETFDVAANALDGRLANCVDVASEAYQLLNKIK